MANMVSAALAGLIGGAWASTLDLAQGQAAGIGVLCFVIGFILATTVMIVLDSAVATSQISTSQH